MTSIINVLKMSPGRSVQVNGWINDKKIGSALAEGPTVEVAEDKAISRLNKRLNPITKDDTNIKTINEDKNKTPLKIELPKSDKIELPKREITLSGKAMCPNV